MAPIDGYGHFMGFVVAEFRHRGHGAEAALYFLDYLFAYFNLRKVYADVFEFNEDSLRPLVKAGFVEEGRLREHVFLNGRHWDLLKFALYREAWEELKDRFARLTFIEDELVGVLTGQRTGSETQEEGS